MEKIEIKNGKLFSPKPSPKGSYVISGKGFLREARFDRDLRSTVVEWCPELKDSLVFSSKQARNIISKFKLEAFVWSPWKETPSKKGYFVRFIIRSNYTLLEAETAPTWLPIRSWNAAVSDYTHLSSGDHEEVVFETLQEATAKAMELNNQLISKIQDRSEELYKYSEKERAERRAAPYGI